MRSLADFIPWRDQVVDTFNMAVASIEKAGNCPRGWRMAHFVTHENLEKQWMNIRYPMLSPILGKDDGSCELKLGRSSGSCAINDGIY